MNDILKNVQGLKDSNILLKVITKNSWKGEFLGMLLGTLEANLLGSMLTRKGILRAGYGNKEEKGMLRAGYGNKIKGNSISSFNKHWNTRVLSEWTHIWWS